MHFWKFKKIRPFPYLSTVSWVLVKMHCSKSINAPPPFLLPTETSLLVKMHFWKFKNVPTLPLPFRGNLSTRKNAFLKIHKGPPAFSYPRIPQYSLHALLKLKKDPAFPSQQNLQYFKFFNFQKYILRILRVLWEKEWGGPFWIFKNVFLRVLKVLQIRKGRWTFLNFQKCIFTSTQATKVKVWDFFEFSKMHFTDTEEFVRNERGGGPFWIFKNAFYEYWGFCA